MSEDVGAQWFAAMRAGDWEAAWRQTDRIEMPRRARAREPGFTRRADELWWDGTPFAGRSVLVRCEHGLGDTLQFLRFVPRVQALARELHLMVQPPLYELLRGRPGLGKVHDGWASSDWPACEVEVEVMELAYALRCTMASVPAPYPHLAPGDFELHAEGDDQPRIALAWAASDWDPSRSLPFEALEPLLAREDLRLFSLQQEHARSHRRLTDLSPRTRRIADCAAAMRRMDAVVCIDGMPAHLAGTLDVPVFLMLKHEADWRWMLAREDTPWYPSMRLVRQPRAGDWDAVVRRLARELFTQERHREPSCAARP